LLLSMLLSSSASAAVAVTFAAALLAANRISRLLGDSGRSGRYDSSSLNADGADDGCAASSSLSSGNNAAVRCRCCGCLHLRLWPDGCLFRLNVPDLRGLLKRLVPVGKAALLESVPCFSVMIGITEPWAAIVARLLHGPDASLGTDWADLVQVGLFNTSLQRLVVSNVNPTAVRTLDMYGHFHTKTQMKHTPGRYWKEDPVPFLSQDGIDLIGKSIDSHARLHLVCTGSVGGILLVTQLFDTNGPVTRAFITILAAPSVVTYRQETTDQGIILDDLWDDSALQGFDPALVTSTAH
jgi:hypothetical protein